MSLTTRFPAGSVAAPPQRRAMGAPMLSAMQQMLAVAAVIGGTLMIAQFGQAPAARLLFFLAAMGLGAYYLRRSPWLFVTVTFWFWTLTPFVRRVIDYNGTFDPKDFIIGTPSAMTLLMLGRIATSRHLLGQREAAAGMLLVVPIAYGLMLSFVSGDVVPGLVAAADWLGPLLYYYYFLTLAPRIEEAEPHFSAFFTLSLIVIAGYGLYQYLDPPLWDALWIKNTGLKEFGPARSYQIRVFGTLNAPVWLAVWLGMLLILALQFRTRVTLLLLPMATIVLLLSQVRAVAGCTALGLVAALFLSRRGTAAPILRSLLLVLVTVGTIGSIALISDPEIANRITERFESLNDLGSDWSGWERQAFYQNAPEIIERSPFGVGIGAVGRGAVAADSGTVIIDSGPVAIFMALGWIFGSVYIIGIMAVLAQAVQAARSSGSQAALVLAAASLASFVNLAFNNLVGFYAAILWFCIGYACAIGIGARLRMRPNALQRRAPAWSRRAIAGRAAPLPDAKP